MGRYPVCRTLFLTLTLALVAHPAPAAAAPPAPAGANTLYVRDLAFDPVTAAPGLAQSLRASGDTGYALVQHQPGAGEAVFAAIRAAGGHVYGPVARNGFLVGGVPLARLQRIKGVRFAGPFEPAYKLEPSLRATAEKPRTGSVTVAVDVFKDAPAVAKAIQGLGGKATVVHPGVGHEAIVATLPETALARLAGVADVRNIEPAATPLPELDIAPVRTGIRSNAGPPWANIHNLDGTGQRLGIYDTGCDTGEPATLVTDLRGRMTGDTTHWANGSMAPTWAGLDYAGQPSSHGTFVSDVAIGNGATSMNRLLTGVAFKASAMIRPFNADSNGLEPGYLNIGTALQNAYGWGARVHNDSWVPATGKFPKLDPITNVYSAQGSAVIDAFANTNPQILIVTSAGNYGPGANTLGTLTNSKNSLAVGNAGNGDPPTGAVSATGVAPDQMANSSSRGPAVSGRLRPEVCAPGAKVAMRCPQSMVATKTCPSPAATYPSQPGFAYATGTSFSTPMVSGAALLLRQFLATQSQRPNATGMLVKALLVNGTTPLSTPAPDNAQGWGEINLARSIDGPGGGRTMYYDSLTERGASFQFTQTGQSLVFGGIAFTGNVPLAITLTWYDPPDATLAGALINDLDLTLTAADGSVYHGGVPSMAGGQTQPNGPADPTNNTEKIVLAQTPAGDSTITVTATNIAAGSPQAFALVVSSVDHQGAPAPAPASGGSPRSLHMLLSPQQPGPQPKP